MTVLRRFSLTRTTPFITPTESSNMTDPITENPAPAEDADGPATTPTRPVSKVKVILTLVAAVVLWILLDEVILGFFAGLFTAIGWTFGAVGNTAGWVFNNGAMALTLLFVLAIVVGIIVLYVKMRNYTLWGPCRNCGTAGNGYRICGRCGRVK